MLRRCDIVSDNKQDANAGNAGDLLKHSAYLALLHELLSVSSGRSEPHVVEAHSGKGVYAARTPHLRIATALPGYASSPLGMAQAGAFAAPPRGLGQLADLDRRELPYAGSAVLHAFELSKLRRRSLVLMDHDAVVRDTVAAVFKEPALEALAHDLRIIDPGARSEPKVLLSLERGEYSPGHILHFDPFAFVMEVESRSVV